MQFLINITLGLTGGVTMYSTPEISEDYQKAWLEAERQLAIMGYIPPKRPIDMPIIKSHINPSPIVENPSK